MVRIEFSACCFIIRSIHASVKRRRYGEDGGAKKGFFGIVTPGGHVKHRTPAPSSKIDCTRSKLFSFPVE